MLTIVAYVHSCITDSFACFGIFGGLNRTLWQAACAPSSWQRVNSHMYERQRGKTGKDSNWSLTSRHPHGRILRWERERGGGKEGEGGREYEVLWNSANRALFKEWTKQKRWNKASTNNSRSCNMTVFHFVSCHFKSEYRHWKQKTRNRSTVKERERVR